MVDDDASDPAKEKREEEANQFLVFHVHKTPLSICKKVRQPESAHRKTQTPIVAKQIEKDMGIFSHILFTEFAFLPNSKNSIRRKGHNMPL